MAAWYSIVIVSVGTAYGAFGSVESVVTPSALVWLTWYGAVVVVFWGVYLLSVKRGGPTP
jgi:hypothetical protein